MTDRSFLFKREPSWLENRLGTCHTLSPAVQSWTYESGSLTQRLRDHYGDAVGVRILSQRWDVPFLSERRLLKLRENRYSLIREVLLHADGKPLILARTVIPAKTIKCAKRNLAHLGSRPLGEVIFSYPKLERVAMDIASIPIAAWTPPAIDAGRIDGTIHGRRTVYSIAQRPMLVSEFFLPEALAI